MESSFSGLSTALTALVGQRRGLETTGQNVANANTDGYTRQRVDLSAIGGGVPALFSTWQGAGGGVTVSDVSRLRNAFLDTRQRSQHADGAFRTDQQQVYGQVETLLAEPTDTGLQSQLGDLWASFHDLANTPGDLAARAALLQQATTVAGTLNHTSTSINTLWSSTKDQFDAITSEVNSTASRVAELNQAVINSNQAGVPANELADQRDQMVLRLSELVGATGSVQPNGGLTVSVGGSVLVAGSTARQLAVTGAHLLSGVATAPVTLQWTDNNSTAAVQSGQAASVLQTLNSILPSYSARLDGVAGTIASYVNNQHAAGYDLNGNQGGPLFSGTTADSIQVAITDPTLVAASSTQGGTLDGANATALANLATASTGPDQAYRSVIADLAVTTQTANQRSTIQTVLSSNADAAVTSESGVNLDEEMTNLLSYQRAYQAAAKVMSAVDSMLDTLINRTGR